MNKNILLKSIVVLSIAYLFLVTINKSYATFRSTDYTVNKFTTADLKGEIEEEFPDDIKNWDDPLTKEVRFSNTGTIGMMLRVNYLENWSNVDNLGNTIYLSNIINGEEVAIKNWTPFWTNEWTLGNDGWYYYNFILEPGKDTQTILDSVGFNKKFETEYKEAKYNLTFNMEYVNADYNAVKEVFGMNANILEDGRIEWTN
ncbi:MULTISPECIES: hypothetical protein [Clostridium]|uniref:hypothetical protein n=1 Tax=Clostridium TaxID=1485 RepID=UPI0018983E76|nr:MULTISPECIES: hypothetical protein [Clostridium]MDI9216600.1 hypothetical protein [Clostridium tertium]